MADLVGISERTVQRALARLVQLGRVIWRSVAGITARVCRLVLGVTSQPAGVSNSGSGVSNSPAGGDSPSGAGPGQTAAGSAG
ncbi:hypothetical protein ACLQ3B_05900 [Micromonospora sp. DT53]|uniref:hypothetical protein n=1 Tax=Micromonospora sp. DT53 TaxID=3393444 RepID=UPI003CE91054